MLLPVGCSCNYNSMMKRLEKYKLIKDDEWYQRHIDFGSNKNKNIENA